MVFEREVPCLSPRDIFIQYLRRALREILQQVSNGIQNDCISFRLEQIIEVLLRSKSVFQYGGQLLSVLRRALVIVQDPPGEFYFFMYEAFLYDAFPYDALVYDAFRYDAFPYDAFPYDAFPYDAFPYTMPFRIRCLYVY